MLRKHYLKVGWLQKQITSFNVTFFLNSHSHRNSLQSKVWIHKYVWHSLGENLKRFSSFSMFSSLTWANLQDIFWKPSLQFSLTSRSNNLSTSDRPTKQFKHSVFSGAQPEFRWEKKKNSSKLKAAYFPAGLYAEAERVALLRGLVHLHLQRRHLARKTSSYSSGLWLFSVTFFQKRQCFC